MRVVVATAYARPRAWSRAHQRARQHGHMGHMAGAPGGDSHGARAQPPAPTTAQQKQSGALIEQHTSRSERSERPRHRAPSTRTTRAPASHYSLVVVRAGAGHSRPPCASPPCLFFRPAARSAPPERSKKRPSAQEAPIMRMHTSGTVVLVLLVLVASYCLLATTRPSRRYRSSA